jgi:GNAT superfamily N-acetyltransferase
MELRQVPFDDAVVQALVAEVQAEFVERYGGPDATQLSASMFEPPAGAFLVGRVGERAVAMGGWRLRPDVQALGGRVAAEIKRMYVEPGSRGLGLSRVVLAALEGSARSAGCDVIVLETGRAQPEAIALYESSGYTPVDGFGIYKDSPLSVYLGKRL